MAAETRFDVAVIGMSGQFPGARDLQEFWKNLTQGVDSIRRFTDEELLRRGVDPESLQHPDFVKAAPVLENPDHFAAAFFGYSPREAELMDPQQRLFLEHAWAAIEDAGYAPRRLKDQVGVFAGMSLSSYLLFNLANNPALDSTEEAFQAMIGGDKDFLCTRLSYKLNFKGPSLTLQTGCSTSLVATHIAVQSLLTNQCDLAITGGVSVGVPQRTGYYYQPGGIASPDGHCRPFDAEAQGTVFGEGVGVLVLKRFEDAIRDRDQIYAVVRGSAINNDGAGKVGFTAPSAAGQTDVISRALAMAAVPADSLTYIETHGTATVLGDPIEVAALAQVFQGGVSKPNSCALGAVKSNIGHLDAAAGIAGLIKTILMLRNRRLVPTLHFRQPNPKIDFSNTPFYVNTQDRPWRSVNGPLRAGVSSFGIGGTNAHIVLEEPPVPPQTGGGRPLQILCLSAETKTALDTAIENLCRLAGENPDVSFADAAFTLHLGREQFRQRCVLVASDWNDARRALQSSAPDRVFANCAENTRPVAFMYPGGGTQYAGMGAELYQNEPVFREEIDKCAELLQKDIGYRLQDLIYPSEKDAGLSTQKLLRPSAGLPAIFATEYALTQLFLSWGIKPACLIGHSLGEYTAACISGVFSLSDALRLVAFRGHIFDSLASGAMLSVMTPEGKVGDLPEGVSIAAVNTHDQCVLSGPVQLIAEVASDLAARGIEHHRLHIDVAAHSPMVEAVMENLRTFLKQIRFSAPAIPFLSNLTGDWITHRQATDPNYWVQHLRRTVRFAEGIQCISKSDDCVMLEVGPGRTLSTFARQQLKESGKPVFTSMRHPQDAMPELLAIYNTLGRMWSVGVPVDWPAFYRFEERRRVSLPSYPFERQRYWISPPSPESQRKPAHSRQRAQLYAPAWKRTDSTSPASFQSRNLWMILADEAGVAADLSKILQDSGQDVVLVNAGRAFAIHGPAAYTVHPSSEEAFVSLFQNLQVKSECAINILHLWTLNDGIEPATSEQFYDAQQNGLYSLLYLVRALARFRSSGESRIVVVSNSAVQVSGGDAVQAAKAPLIAACTVIPQEYGSISCALLDVAPLDSRPSTIQRIATQVLAEAATACDMAPVIAYRGWQRWIRDYERIVPKIHADSPGQENSQPVYMITGGLGSLGLVLAAHLAEKGPCRIVLTTRSEFPAKAEWSDLLLAKGTETKLRQTIASLMCLGEKGSEVVVARTDVANRQQMEELFSHIEATLGRVEGVIHMAGITGDKALRLVADLDLDEFKTQVRPKIEGCYALQQVLQNRSVRFCALFSSTASLLGGPGMLAYAAASCFLDAFASNRRLEGLPWISINWDGWLHGDSSHFVGGQATSLDRYALQQAQALAAFDAILLSKTGGQIVVSSGDVSSRIEKYAKLPVQKDALPTAAAHLRPSLSVEYSPPGNALQKTIATIWSEVLGIEQIGIHDNLFELGGNSLIGLRIVARLKRELSIDMPVTALFEGPTISTLSRLIHARQSPSPQETYTGSRKRGELRRKARQAAEAVS